MKRLRQFLEGFVIACSMYSRIPMPRMEWTEGGMRFALCFFPVTGVAVGAAEWGFLLLARAVSLGDTARACIGTAIPLLITGGIHMDGFLDTADARNSFAGREERLRILKDPHTGAFALIEGGVYLLLYAAVFSELPDNAFPAAGAVYVLTRAFSGFSVVCFAKAKKDGLASTFSAGADRRAVLLSLAVWALAASAWLCCFLGAAGGLLPTFAALLLLWYYRRMSQKEFGGVTGDLAGWFLQVCELAMLAVLVLEGRPGAAPWRV